MEAQTEDMEAEIHTAAPVRAPLMADRAAAEALTVATATIRIPTAVPSAVEAAKAEGNLLMEAIIMVAGTNLTANQTLPLTALTQPLVVMVAQENRDHHILVVTATAAMARITTPTAGAPLQAMEAKARALAMAIPVASHPLVAMVAPLQAMARPLAMARTQAMEAPLQAMARTPATANLPAM